MTRTKSQKAKRSAARKAATNAGNIKGSIARTRRSDAPGISPQYSTGATRIINRRFSWPMEDSTSMRVRFSSSFTGTISTAGSVFALDPTVIATPGYTSLGSLSALVVAMSTAYSRFIVTDLMFKVTSITPITNGGFIGLGYAPDNTNVSGPPATLRDATSATHSDIAQVGESATITVDPSSYFIDWRPTLTSGATAPDNQCGTVQVYVDGGASTIAKWLIEVDCMVHFAGYRTS